jgi:hypothetical protein
MTCWPIFGPFGSWDDSSWTVRGSHEEGEVYRRTDGQDCPRGGDKKPGISDQTIYGSRRRYGALAPADVKRLRQLEHQNVPRKLVADRDLELDVMLDALSRRLKCTMV